MIINHFIESRICPDFLAFAILIGLIYLLRHNILLNKRKTQQFMATGVILMIIIVMEILTVIFENSSVASFRIPFIIANIIGFSLSPVAAFMMGILYSERIEKKWQLLMIPLIIYSLICISSAWTGWIFYVSPDNVYSRGPLFILNAIVSAYSFIIFILANHEGSHDYDKHEKTYLHFLYIIILLGNIAQIINSHMLLIWGSASVSLFLYYIFLRELEFKYDPLTRVRNRKVFETKMMTMQQDGNAVIAIFDINSLKSTNDELGHAAGDELISKAAAIIQNHFRNIGTVYRIGGDEFCVLGNLCTQEILDSSLSNFHKTLHSEKTSSGKAFEIACGYAWFKSASNNTSIYDAFKQADKNMYTDKNVLKSRQI